MLLAVVLQVAYNVECIAGFLAVDIVHTVTQPAVATDKGIV